MGRAWSTVVWLAFAALLLAALPPLLPSYGLTLLTQALIYAIFAMSLDLLLGYTGLPSLGHAAYFGAAAYAVAIFATEYRAGFWTCLPVALLAALALGALFGLLAIRAVGTYFLMITLALGMVTWGLAFRWVSVTKGDNGISAIPRPSLGLPWSFWDQTAFYYLTLVTFLLAFVLLMLVVRSPFGLTLRGIRESERRMRSLGYDVWLHKYLAFVMAAGFAGLAGVLWAYYNGFVSPVEVQLVTSVEALLMVALGGPGTLLGPALGAGAIVFLKNFVSIYTERWLLILGGVYIGTILFAPQGIVGTFRRRREEPGRADGPAKSGKEQEMRYRWRLWMASGLAVLGTLVAGPREGHAQRDPIRIGFLAPLTGPFAQIGKDMVTGTEVYLDEIGREAAGRKIELIVEDSEGNPATALTKARKLVEQTRVHILTGGLLASTGYALHPYVDSQQIPTTYPVASSDDLTKRVLAKWVVRTGWSSSQPMHPFGDWVAKTLKYRKVATIGMDYAFGWETVGGFQRSFEEAGGQIVQKIWVPLNANDLAPYLAQIRKDADAVFALFLGRLALQFVKQYQEVGLKARLPLIGGGTLTDEHALPSMGDEAIGIVTALHYSAALDTPANRKFAQAFEARAGKVPSYYAEICYTNLRWIAEAVKAVNGNVEDRQRLLEALRAVQIPDAPRGPLSADKYGNPVQNIYVRKVERVGGALQNTVLHTFPNVSQFWTYEPEAFLKTPLYVRDYPPCRHC